MTHDLDLIDKLAIAYQPLTKSVSDLGASVKKNNDEVVDLKRMFKDHAEKVDKMLDSHEDAIVTLNKDKTIVTTSIKNIRFFAIILATVITTLGGYIVTSWTNELSSMNQRLTKSEEKRQETLEKVLQELNVKKNYLNQSDLRDIIANVYK